MTRISVEEDKVILQVASLDNRDSGLYLVDIFFEFESGKATKSCTADLEIAAQKVNSSIPLNRREPPRFNATKIDQYTIEFEDDEKK